VPVPPYGTAIKEAFHVPVVTVPMDDKEESVVTAEVIKVPDTGNVKLVVLTAVNVIPNPPESERFDPAEPIFKILLLLLSNPFLATNLVVVAIL
jgi:hypothetical protein